MMVLGIESFGSRISWVFSSRSSSFSSCEAAARRAEVEGTRCVEGKEDSRKVCLLRDRVSFSSAEGRQRVGGGVDLPEEVGRAVDYVEDDELNHRYPDYYERLLQ